MYSFKSDNVNSLNTKYSSECFFNNSIAGQVYNDQGSSVVKLDLLKLFNYNLFQKTNLPGIFQFCIKTAVFLTLFTLLLVFVMEKKNSIVTKSTIFSNQEFGIFFDMLVFLLLLVTTIFGFFFNYQSFIEPIFNTKHLLLLNILIIASLSVQLPLQFFFNTSVFSLTNIKGSLKKTSKIHTVLEDIIGLLTFNIRYMIQLIRWVISITVLFLLHEYFYEIKIAIPSLNNTSFVNLQLTDFLVIAIRFTLEYVDLVFIAILQFSALCAILFWLLPFLFSTNTKNIFETLK